MAKIKHTRNENGQNFTHQIKTTLFWRKKAKINLHQNFPIYGTMQFLKGQNTNISIDRSSPNHNRGKGTNQKAPLHKQLNN